MNTLNAKSRSMNPSEGGAAFSATAGSRGSGVSLIIPAYNEEDVIEQTLVQLPAGIFSKVIVADNASSDRTAEIARRAGATVVSAPMRGYGYACLAALEICADNEILVFLQADGSEPAAEALDLIAPIAQGEADLVIGSRVLGEREGRVAPGALRSHQVFGNWLATTLLRWFWGFPYTDLGPFRAIRAGALRMLALREGRYGWTVEMQMRALDCGLRVREIPVGYGLRQAGEEKVSGNWRASLLAGYTILRVVLAGGIRRLLR